MTIHDLRVRALTPDDWEIFRDIRLMSLTAHPAVYGSTHAREKDFAREEWQERLNGGNQAVFGGFIGNELVGIAGIVPYREDAEAAVLVMWFIKSAYRGTGCFEWIVQACIDWVHQSGVYSRIIVAHRGSNEASRKTNQKFGFVYTHKTPHVWPDGQTEDEYFYERIMR